MSGKEGVANDFEFSSSEDEKYLRDNVLICRVKPSMMQFVDKFCDSMAMSRSEMMRFSLNKLKYEYAMGMTLQDIKERIVWVNESARKYNMSVERYVSFCLDLMRVLDMSGMLEVLVTEMKVRRETQVTKSGSENITGQIPNTKNVAKESLNKAKKIQSHSISSDNRNRNSDYDE